MSQLNDVKEFMLAAGQTVRDRPTRISPEEAVLRVRLLLEEVFELAEAAGVDVSLRGPTLEDSKPVVFDDLILSGGLQTRQDVIEIADALSDIAYVNNGAALSWGIDLDHCFDLVQASNMSKFIDGHRHPETGKWIKGPSYTPVDLSFIGKGRNRKEEDDGVSYGSES